MDFYDKDFFYRCVLPPVDYLWGWLVPLLLDDSVSIVFCVKTIFV
jgi:esterase/lipase superfamily enzyme